MGKDDTWDLVTSSDNPCAGPLVDSYLKIPTEEQKQVEVKVNHADTLPHVLAAVSYTHLTLPTICSV